MHTWAFSSSALGSYLVPDADPGKRMSDDFGNDKAHPGVNSQAGLVE
jgi:hypothetical protein